MNWKEIFDYLEGNLYWKIDNGSNKTKGKLVGYINSTGYRVFKYKRKHYTVHRIIYEMFKGLVDKNVMVDHIDRNKLNNKIENLRLASNSENQRNRKLLENNTSGFRGVNFHKRDKKYQAVIYDNNKPIYLGYFNTAEEASKVYELKAKELFGEFYNEL